VVVVVVVFVVEEVVVVVFPGEVVFGAFEVSFDVELGGGVEGGVGFLEALESPGEADGAVCEEEFGGGHGAEVGDEGAAEVVEGGGVFVGEEGGGGEPAVAEGVLGGGAFAGGCAGAGGFLGVLAVGGEFFFGDGGGRSCGGGHGVLPFCWGDGFLVAIIGRCPPGAVMIVVPCGHRFRYGILEHIPNKCQHQFYQFWRPTRAARLAFVATKQRVEGAKNGGGNGWRRRGVVAVIENTELKIAALLLVRAEYRTRREYTPTGESPRATG
jgi:hypothetical protein